MVNATLREPQSSDTKGESPIKRANDCNSQLRWELVYRKRTFSVLEDEGSASYPDQID